MESSARALSREENADELSQQLSSLQLQTSRLHVLFQEDCLQHKFARRDSQGALKSSDDIVERPERLSAVKAGVAAAYCRLQTSPLNLPANPEDHTQLHLRGEPFDIRYTKAFLPLTHESVLAVHNTANLGPDEEDLNNLRPLYPVQLQGWIDDAAEAHAAGKSEIPANLSQGDLYLSPGSKAAIEGSVGCVCQAVEEVSESGGGSRFCVVRPPGHQ